MAETIDLVRDSTMQGIARSVAAIAANTGGFKINSFADVQAIVRAGMADKVFAIGDQIIAEKETAITATVGNTGHKRHYRCHSSRRHVHSGGRYVTQRGV